MEKLLLQLVMDFSRLGHMCEAQDNICEIKTYNKTFISGLGGMGMDRYSQPVSAASLLNSQIYPSQPFAVMDDDIVWCHLMFV